MKYFGLLFLFIQLQFAETQVDFMKDYTNAQLLEMFDLFSARLILNEIDFNEYLPSLYEHTKCKPNSVTETLYKGFIGGIQAISERG